MPSAQDRDEHGGLFAGYRPLPGAFDELCTPDGAPRPEAARAVSGLDALGRRAFGERQRLADGGFLKAGVTFSVYSDRGGVERIFPFDLVPRIVDASAWERLERGLIQRVTALNMFLQDMYGDQRILAEGKVPTEIALGSSGYLEKMRGVRPPHGVYMHVCGTDLVRDPSGEFTVLEDNGRSPSGVSYVLENRAMMKRVLPRVFAESRVRSVDAYPARLLSALNELAPDDTEDPRVVVLSPGPFNSAYFEHSFLARRMGCDLVLTDDLFVHDDRVYVKTTHGPARVHVIYRRIDDEFLDPDVFRADSLLGVRGLIRAYRAGHVTIANAVGNGVCDDKAIYPYVPDMIRFYLSEEPIVGQVPTLICAEEEDRKQVLSDLGKYVVKAVDASGGYGMLVGPAAGKAELEEFRKRIEENPRGYIAQPLIELSTCPTWSQNGLYPRRVDLRPYIITGRKTWVLPGGLTRVALREGSYVVNSSQGGGSKDTWVLEPEAQTEAESHFQSRQPQP
ncbi:MAG: circularly permuted type 2 ATP-grasp protein [Myxococcales bacterium]|jgi:uncharacterized circularly permuted ATP-grasp superfamily protein